MTTKKGTIYNNMTNTNDDTLTNITQQLTQLVDLVQILNQRINTLEQGQHQRTQEFVSNEHQDQNGRETNRDDRVLRNVRVDAPSFDGTLDPVKFLDWLSEIEDYFEWYGLEDVSVGFVDYKPCFSLMHGSVVCLY